MKKILIAAALIVPFVATPALADFWVVREGTADCRIVETRPADTKITIMGNKVFKTRDEATKEMAVLCKK
jgi:hypothetical protein